MRLHDLPEATVSDLRTWLGRAVSDDASEMVKVRRAPFDVFDSPWWEDEERMLGYAARETDLPPILARRTKDGRLRIVDGNHRYGAARHRGAGDVEYIDIGDWLA